MIKLLEHKVNKELQESAGRKEKNSFHFSLEELYCHTFLGPDILAITVLWECGAPLQTMCPHPERQEKEERSEEETCMD